MSGRSYAFLLTGCLLIAPVAAARQWPSQPIKIILSGSSDLGPRVLAAQISEWLGQKVILESHPGASGVIAADYVLRQPADGYTFLNATSGLAAASFTFKEDFQLTRSFVPVCLDGTDPFVLVVYPHLPVHSVTQLIALAKKQPGKLNYAATSPGSSSDLVAERFKQVAHINIVHVPYKSMARALIDVVAGQIKVGMSVGALAASEIRAGKVRALAVTTAKRSPALPNVPTFLQLGFPIVLPGWNGLVARKGTPPAIIARVNADLVRALHTPKVRKTLERGALDPGGGTPADFGAFMKASLKQWGEAAKAAHLTKRKNVHHA